MKQAEIIELPKVPDARGNLSFVEECVHVPFNIARAWWIYDVPGGESRGEHAHKELDELIIAMSGSFKVLIDNGHERKEFFLNRPYQGLFVPAGIWLCLHDFSSGAVAMTIASDVYKESDYIRDYDEFIKFKQHENGEIS